MNTRQERKLKSDLIAFLEQNGFAAAPIPEGSKPTADIEATDLNGKSYLFEVKARTVAWSDKAEPAATLEQDAVAFQRIDTPDASGALYRVFEKAATQLGGHPNDSSFRIAWFVVEASDWSHHYKAIANTAYGTAIVSAIGRQPMMGYYVHHAAFAQWRHLDGVLLGLFDALLLNDLTLRHRELKNSALADFCGDIYDSKELEASNQCYYLNPLEAEAHPDRSLERLQSKYELTQPHLISLRRFSAVVSSGTTCPKGTAT